MSSASPRCNVPLGASGTELRSLIQIDGSKLSHPDLLLNDGRDNEYIANEDGTVVKYTVYSYTFSNGVATSKSYVGQVDCTLTEYTSIEEWYNATYNS